MHTPSTTIAAGAGGSIVDAVSCSCISLAEVLATEIAISKGDSRCTSDGAEIRWISTPLATGSLRSTVLLCSRPASPMDDFHTTSIRPAFGLGLGFGLAFTRPQSDLRPARAQSELNQWRAIKLSSNQAIELNQWRAERPSTAMRDARRGKLRHEPT